MQRQAWKASLVWLFWLNFSWSCKNISKSGWSCWRHLNFYLMMATSSDLFEHLDNICDDACLQNNINYHFWMVWLSCWALPALSIYAVLALINNLFGERISFFLDCSICPMQFFSKRSGSRRSLSSNSQKGTRWGESWRVKMLIEISRNTWIGMSELAAHIRCYPWRQKTKTESWAWELGIWSCFISQLNEFFAFILKGYAD